MTAVAVPSGDDIDLVAAVRRGDDQAFEALYARYHTRIAAYVRGMVKDHARAEDVTQEVFFSALRRMRDTERPIAFRPWIYEIARNACIDAYRRTSRAEELSYDVDGGLSGGDRLRLVSGGQSPDDAVESKQRLDDLCGAFGGLSDVHHQILVLRELEGMSYREIGERLGMSRAAVESTLFRARRRLTEEYEELVSGRRCVRVRAIIATAAEGMLGVRDRRRLAHHLATCQSCRCQARRLGVDGVSTRVPVRARLAGLLPLPTFLHRGRDSGRDVTGAAGGHGSSYVAHLSSTLGAAAEPAAATWAKAVAAVAAMAIAGLGAGVATKGDLSLPALRDLPALGAIAGDRGGDAGDDPASAGPTPGPPSAASSPGAPASGTIGDREHTAGVYRSSTSTGLGVDGASRGAGGSRASGWSGPGAEDGVSMPPTSLPAAPTPPDVPLPLEDGGTTGASGPDTGSGSPAASLDAPPAPPAAGSPKLEAGVVSRPQAKVETPDEGAAQLDGPESEASGPASAPSGPDADAASIGA